MSERIQLTDSVMDIVIKMSDGNPGAVTVCMSLLTEAAKIDPDHFIPGIGQILSLDSIGIYEERIWMLYKDVCKENLVALCAVLRAHQFGELSRESILSAIDGDKDGFDVDEIIKMVKEKLPDFAKNKVD